MKYISKYNENGRECPVSKIKMDHTCINSEIICQLTGLQFQQHQQSPLHCWQQTEQLKDDHLQKKKDNKQKKELLPNPYIKETPLKNALS